MITAPSTRRKIGWSLFLLLMLALPVSRAVFLRHQPALVGLPLSGKTFVIDPGHGGYDPGVIRHNVLEKTVALSISLYLRDYLQSAGARVVMTREIDKDLLVLPAAGPKKRQDMKNRMKIINEAEPDIVVSVHANAIGSGYWRGAQVFYRKGSEDSKLLAEAIQQELIRVLANTGRTASPGDYFVLEQAVATGVIVETGFISNAAEAELLTEAKYQSKVAWAIYLGIMRYCAQLPESH